VNKQVTAILDPYRQRVRRADPPAGARQVLLHYSAFPDDAEGLRHET